MNPNWIDDFIVERNVKQKPLHDTHGEPMPTYYNDAMQLFILQASNGVKVTVNEPALKAMAISAECYTLFNDRKAQPADVIFFIEDNFKELLDIRSVA